MLYRNMDWAKVIRIDETMGLNIHPREESRRTVSKRNVTG